MTKPDPRRIDELLLRHAAGSLDAGLSLLVETYLDISPAGRRLHAQFEAIGGLLLDAIEPVDADPSALHMSGLNDLFHDSARHVDRYRKTYSDIAAAYVAGIGYGVIGRVCHRDFNDYIAIFLTEIYIFTRCHNNKTGRGHYCSFVED